MKQFVTKALSMQFGETLLFALHSAECNVITIIKSVTFCEVLSGVRVEFGMAFENGSAGCTWYLLCQGLCNKESC